MNNNNLDADAEEFYIGCKPPRKSRPTREEIRKAVEYVFNEREKLERERGEFFVNRQASDVKFNND